MRQGSDGALNRFAQIYGAAAGFIFFASGAVYLFLGRWPVTHQDFWVFYDNFLHRSWFYSSIVKYNGHSLIFPCQIWLANLHFFHGSQDSLFAIGLAFELAATAILLLAIFRDRSIDATIRIAATVTIIFGNFWMGRASMTASGAFNCAYSLVLVGATLAFLCLPKLAGESDRQATLLVTILVANVVASFSFGTGMAAWGATLVTAYCLRARGWKLAVLAAAATASAVIFLALPPHGSAASFGASLPLSRPATYLTLFGYLCRLLGSPWLHMCAAWSGVKNPDEAVYAGVAMYAGLLGLLLVSAVLAEKLWRRNLRGGMELIGFALLIFNFIAFILIIIARARHIHEIPSELNAPRYLYWSALFWTGAFLLALTWAQSKAGLRWPIIASALALPIIAFPSHYQEALRFRYVRMLGQTAGTSLVNGIHDNTQIQILSPFPDLVYRLSQEMRARRLDMFAPGYQDWIGQRATAVFPAPLVTLRLNGKCHGVGVGPGNSALRLNGSAATRAKVTPDVLVILGPDEVVRGIARSTATGEWLNHFIYGRTFSPFAFVGFIADYNPQLAYKIRAVKGRSLSRETIAVPISAEQP